MENYRVVSITDREGNPRTDGKYPLRIGRTCTKPDVRIGAPMIIQWVSKQDGTPYFGELMTSMAIAVLERADSLKVTTRNSIYTFKKV